MEEKVKSMTLDQLHDEKNELKELLGWGTWTSGLQTDRQAEAFEILTRNLRDVEDEIELRVFGEVLLY